MKPPLPPLVAHRGESALAPENTLAAIDLAWKNGADAVEFDIWMTRDRRFILCHDRDTLRTTGQSFLIPDHNADDLRRLDAGAIMGPRWTGQPMPLLEEALALTPPGKRLYIELKSGTEAVPGLAKALRGWFSPSPRVLGEGAEPPVPGNIVLICFALPVLAELRRELPDHTMYLLANIPRQGPDQPTEQQLIDRLITEAREHRFNGLDLHHKLLNESTINQIHNAGLEAHAWTVDNPAEARRLITAGVDSITTNRPSHLRQALT
jgi:glycerophosphoryl diester phosphodiesterase